MFCSKKDNKMKTCFKCSSCECKYDIEDLTFIEFIKQFPSALPHGWNCNIKLLKITPFYKIIN